MALVGPTAEGGSASAPWPTEAVGKCLAPVALPAVKLPTAEYRPSGKYPIIDQGQAPIAGWTDNEEGVIAAQLPVIVFGDHTRTFKYVDFPFVRGADGTQVLKPRSDLHPRFFYYACKALDLSSRGYNRHFTLLKEKSIPVPSWQEQVRIAEVLEAVDEHGRLQAEQMEATVRLFRVLLHRLMSGEIQPQGPTPESEPQLATVAK
ncbi:MAG TPA: restriction endonuclease subunit S [Candidatus Limnocylindria bacterium]|nr:restriction endonuclease subunit S [Candidatus Limnocylindria bacterium]